MPVSAIGLSSSFQIAILPMSVPSWTLSSFAVAVVLSISFVHFPLIAAAEETSASAELDTLRGIAVSPKATYSDLCNIVMIQRGEFEKFETAVERCENLTKDGIYNFEKIGDVLNTPVTSGAAAKVAINAHGLEKSIMFLVTRMEWYAVQNAEALDLLPAKTRAGRGLSGEELLGLMEKAAALSAEKAQWAQAQNPYEDFGAKSYEELDKAYQEQADPDAVKKPAKK